jgi:hypothetical protein
MPWKPRYRKPGETKVPTTVRIRTEDYDWVVATNAPGYRGVRWNFSELLEKAIASAKRAARDKELADELARVEKARAEVERVKAAIPVPPGTEL